MLKLLGKDGGEIELTTIHERAILTIQVLTANLVKAQTSDKIFFE